MELSQDTPKIDSQQKPELTIEIPTINIELTQEKINETIQENIKTIISVKDATIDNIYKQLIQNKEKLKNASVFEIIVICMELVETGLVAHINKKEIVVAVLERLSKGFDGIDGTSDDLISQDTIKMIKYILDNALIDGIIETVIKASKQIFNINKNKKWWCCF